MNLFFKEKYNFTDYELETLLSIGKTIGLAMANARNIEKIKAEIEERKKAQEAMAQSIASLKIINTVADRVYCSFDYKTLAKEAVAAMIQYGKTPTISMFEYNEAEKCLILLDYSKPFKGTKAADLTRKLYLDKSLTGYAVLEKKIILCPDIAKDQHILLATRKALLKQGLKSAVFIPLLFRDRVLGVMNLFFPQKYTFADYELETLFSIGKTIGLAMANAKHIEQIKADAEERIIIQEALHKTEQSLSESQQNAKISNESLKIINAVADRIYLAHDYDALVKEAMEAVKLYGKTSAVVMFECNEDENTIALLSTSAEPDEFKATTVRLTSTLLPESLTAQTIREKRIIICDDAANDERINPEIRKMLIKYNLTRVISIPLLFRDKTLGVINLFFAEKYNFTDYELETLLSIGKTIGLAMANARYIQQIKTEVEKRKIAQDTMAQSNASLKTVNMMADRLYQSFDFQTIARDAVESITMYTNAPRAALFEFDEANQFLRLIYNSSFSRETLETVAILPIAGSLSGLAVKSKKVIVADVVHDKAIAPAVKKALLNEGLTRAISIPLLFQDKVLGVMNLLFESQESNEFPDYEKETLFSIGKTIGLAMANARHIQQIKAEVKERKEAADALRESEAKYRGIFDNSIEGIFQSLPDGKLLTVNQSFAKIFGYESPEEIIKAINTGQNPFYVNLCEAEAAMQIAIKQGFISDFEFHAYKKDKSIAELLANVRVAYDDQGNISYFEGMLEDISEKKKAQEALSQSEEKYRLLIENAGDAIFIGREGFITYANPCALELFGYTMEELAQKPIAFYLIAEDMEKESNKMGKKSADGAKSFKLINRNFEELSLEVHIIDALWEGKKASLYFGRDVTVQKKMEAQLYQAQKMEAVGTLAGGLAHDFNNLLMGIEGNISLMLLQIPPGHPHHERLKNIEHYVSSGAEITGQLLGFARGGKYELRALNLNNLMEKSAVMFGRTKKEISIHMNFQEDLWSMEVNQGQIEQVLLNLYVNAWQAMPGGGHLYLTTINMDIDNSMAEVHRIQPGSYIRASITDGGVGMDEDTQRRVFEPFFTTKGRSRGTGLGLASAYGIIKNHGGVITVYSEKGKGTTFNIYLPASLKEAKTDEAFNRDSLFFGKETILFVDDEEMIVSVGKDMLESMGYKVITANSGKEALQIYENNKANIDLVIFDLIMPDMGGEVTFKKLQEINPAVKTVVSSGYSIGDQATKLLQQGCRGFIQKPYSINELSARIREILDMK
jgi:PAS domain S-box-containing protein